MSDNTQLATTSGGDVIATIETIDRSTGAAVSVKSQVIVFAAKSGIVTQSSPLPVE